MAWVHCPVPPGCCSFGGGHISLAVLLVDVGGHSHKQRGRWRPLPSYVSVVLFLRVGVLLMCEWGLEARLIKQQQQQPRNKAKCANVASRCETDESGLLFLHTTQRYTGLKKLFANELLLLLLWCWPSTAGELGSSQKNHLTQERAKCYIAREHTQCALIYDFNLLWAMLMCSSGSGYRTKGVR